MLTLKKKKLSESEEFYSSTKEHIKKMVQNQRQSSGFRGRSPLISASFVLRADSLPACNRSPFELIATFDRLQT